MANVNVLFQTTLHDDSEIPANLTQQIKDALRSVPEQELIRQGFP